MAFPARRPNNDNIWEPLKIAVRAEVSKRWFRKLLIQHGTLCPSMPESLPQHA